MTSNVLDHLEAQGARVTLGIPAIDAACRGGVPLGKRIVLGGAPGAGKTTLLVQWAFDLARTGVECILLATDESAAALAIRLGQLAGESRDLLERRDKASLTRANLILGPLPIAIYTDVSIEVAADRFTSNGPRFFGLDSLQTARTLAPCKGKKSLVETNVRALDPIAKRGALVVATSELSRESYKRKNSSGGLGGYKGSGDVEYAFDLALELRSPAYGITNVSTPKNRLGDRPECMLILDRDRARFTERTETPDALVQGTSKREPSLLWLLACGIDDAIRALAR